MMDFLQRDFGYSVSFLQWMVFGVPMGILTFLGFWAAFRYIVRPDVGRVTGIATDYLREQAKAMGTIKLKEKLVLIIFIAVVFCWLFPGIPGNILPTVKDFLDRMGYAIPALIGTALLCIIKVRGESLLTFRQWMTEGVEWGTVCLCGAIFAIGKVIGDPGTGIPEFMTNIFQPIANSLPLYGVIMLSLLWVVVQTNLMSNMVSTTLVYTVMMPIFVTIGIGNPIALGTALSGASYFALSLPSATAVTAIATGSGWVPVSFMARYGLLFIIPIVLMFTFIQYPIASIIFSGAVSP
jgi:sodium-dependent dicarboxylate transporter 2/3/5